MRPGGGGGGAWAWMAWGMHEHEGHGGSGGVCRETVAPQGWLVACASAECQSALSREWCRGWSKMGRKRDDGGVSDQSTIWHGQESERGACVTAMRGKPWGVVERPSADKHIHHACGWDERVAVASQSASRRTADECTSRAG